MDLASTFQPIRVTVMPRSAHLVLEFDIFDGSNEPTMPTKKRLVPWDFHWWNLASRGRHAAVWNILERSEDIEISCHLLPHAADPQRIYLACHTLLSSS